MSKGFGLYNANSNKGIWFPEQTSPPCIRERGEKNNILAKEYQRPPARRDEPVIA